MDAGLVSYAAAVVALLVLGWQAAIAIQRALRRWHRVSGLGRAAPGVGRPAAGAQPGQGRALKNVRLRRLALIEESVRARGRQITLGIIAPDYVLYGLPPSTGGTRRPPRVF